MASVVRCRSCTACATGSSPESTSGSTPALRLRACRAPGAAGPAPPPVRSAGDSQPSDLALQLADVGLGLLEPPVEDRDLLALVAEPLVDVFELGAARPPRACARRPPSARSSLRRFCVCWRSCCLSPMSAPSRFGAWAWAGWRRAVPSSSASSRPQRTGAASHASARPRGEQPAQRAQHGPAADQREHLRRREERPRARDRASRAAGLEARRDERVRDLERGERQTARDQALGHALEQPRQRGSRSRWHPPAA